nr:DUF3320 domain-containing protein [Neokomagataea anthophila]
MAVDIRRARLQKIRPLGVVASESEASDEATRVIREGLEVAPSLPAFDTDILKDETPDSPTGRIQQWQRKLLNLTTSNNLLSIRSGKSMLRLHCPSPAVLEDMLAAEKILRLVPMPDLAASGRDQKIYEQQNHATLADELAEQALQRLEVMSELPKDKLDAALIELFRKTRASFEEGGANTLFLAFGVLKWKKSPNDEKAYRAPLILVPVQLDRKSVQSGMTMKAHEDEARFNLTLLELLRQDFALEIPGLDGDLPKDQSGLDVDAIWRRVREAVCDMPGFEVVPEVVLGSFSFAKYLMWRDLVERGADLKESPVVHHLIERDGSVHLDDGDDFPKAEQMDQRVDPAQLFTPLPADSSQLVAVYASAEGRNFVLDGPPGTGKSQTIANIIAHNMALGRRVLFVAEKQAALDVVQRRLASKGLGPFCLELHSAKATKSAVLKQLDSAWTARDSFTAEEWAREANDIRRLRDELNDVVKLLHAPDPNGWTLHRAIGRVVRDWTDATPRLVFHTGTRHSEEEMITLRENVRRLGIARKAVSDLPSDLKILACSEWSNAWQDRLVAAARALPEAIKTVERTRDDVLAATQFNTEIALQAEPDQIAALVEACLATYGHDMACAFLPDIERHITSAQEGLDLLDAYRTDEATLSTTYAHDAVRKLEIEPLQADLAAALGKMWPMSGLARRKVAASLTQAGGCKETADPEKDLPKLLAMRTTLTQCDAAFQAASSLPGLKGTQTERAVIEASIARIRTLRAAMAVLATDPAAMAELKSTVTRLVVDAHDLLIPGGNIANGLERLKEALSALKEKGEVFTGCAQIAPTAGFEEIRLCAAAIMAYGPRLNAWTAWQRARNEAVQAGILPIVQGLEDGTVAPDPDEALSAFDTAYAKWFAATRIDAEPLLKHFVAGEQEDRIDRFRAVDERMSDLSSRYIRARICGQIPDKSARGKKDGFATLRHQLQLQRPSKPIRKLASEMGEAFTQLAPCMLMSPLSIAQYLPPDQALFDLVIFDEASQITPWDAIGAMARAKQVIVAGDPRQMPPSNDFQRSSGVTTLVDDDAVQDLPSILDECLAAGVPSHRLSWHYRSRHESLITFSNSRYYGNELVTFPAPETRASAVTWKKVPGVYTPGVRTNPIEAQALVAEVVQRLRDPNFVDGKGQPLSLGIITMNAEQMRLVEDLLDKARQEHPEIEPHFSADDREEPVVVRNLETVQGDERDLILLGVNFGPTEPGGQTMSMAFGKLNGNGGGRRLNVATTRARCEMVVFTSFDPSMIDLTRTSVEGVRDLKAFIDFANRGPRALAEAVKGSMGGSDSPFEDAVTWALRKRGWTVVPQVGVSKFRIDMGVVHPDRPGDYLAGVECDGASYHSAATARDRDKVRQAILEKLGWTLVRIWSTNWWHDKEGEAQKLDDRLKELLAADRQAREEREKRAVPAPPETPSEPVLESAPETVQLAERTEPFHAGLPAAAVGAEFQPVVQREAPKPRVEESVYRATPLTSFNYDISADDFNKKTYDPILKKLIARTVHQEAPLSEDLLVQRIARAHGFQRSGRLIRERIMTIASRRYFLETEPEGETIIWLKAEDRDVWSQARAPETENDIRPIEQIALQEIKAARQGRDVEEVALYFGIRRLSAKARARIEGA